MWGVTSVGILPVGYEVVKRIIRPGGSSVKFFLTYDCNQKCKICNIWSINRTHPELQSKEVTLEEVQKFMVANPGILLVSLTGGEPTLKENFKSVLEIVENAPGPRTIAVTTNGSNPEVLKESIIYALDKNKNKALLLVFQVSMYGPETLQDSFTRTVGSFHKAKASLDVLKDLESKYPKLIRTRINFTVSKFNEGCLEDCLTELGKSCPTLDRIGLETAVDMDELYCMRGMNVAPSKNAIQSDAKWLRKHQPLKAWFDPISLITTELPLRQREKGITTVSACSALRTNCSIDPYWGLHPCAGLSDTFAGNLRNFDFSIRKASNATSSIWKPQVKDCFKDRVCKGNCNNWANILSKPWKLL